MATAASAQRENNQNVRIYPSKAQAAVTWPVSAFKAVLSISIVLFLIVFMAAYAADLQQKNNTLEAENSMLQAEIDSLSEQIDDATSIEKIEKIATEELGMVQPDESNYIILSDDEQNTDDQSLASTIKEEAYD